MPLDQLLLFLTVTLFVSASPGPVVLSCLANGGQYGVRKSLYGMAGASLGNLLLMLLSVVGLGLVLNRATGHAAKAFWTTYTPIDLETVEVHFAMMAARSDARDPTGELSKKSLRATLVEFEKDIPIWENKIYRAHPLLCPGDGPIAHYRRWARQFYPQGA